jgi:hypothetical protein
MNHFKIYLDRISVEFNNKGLDEKTELIDACQEVVENIKNGKSKDYTIVFAFTSGFMFFEYVIKPEDFHGFTFDECIAFIFLETPRLIQHYNADMGEPFHLYFCHKIKSSLRNFKTCIENNDFKI